MIINEQTAIGARGVKLTDTVSRINVGFMLIPKGTAPSKPSQYEAYFECRGVEGPSQVPTQQNGSDISMGQHVRDRVIASQFGRMASTYYVDSWFDLSVGGVGTGGLSEPKVDGVLRMDRFSITLTEYFGSGLLTSLSSNNVPWNIAEPGVWLKCQDRTVSANLKAEGYAEATVPWPPRAA